MLFLVREMLVISLCFSSSESKMEGKIKNQIPYRWITWLCPAPIADWDSLGRLLAAAWHEVGHKHVEGSIVYGKGESLSFFDAMAECKQVVWKTTK